VLAFHLSRSFACFPSSPIRASIFQLDFEVRPEGAAPASTNPSMLCWINWRKNIPAC
jgi:hypothetical protein